MIYTLRTSFVLRPPLTLLQKFDFMHVMFFCWQSDPKRLKKDLPKILKTLKPEDRVLIVGTSRMPFGIL